MMNAIEGSSTLCVGVDMPELEIKPELGTTKQTLNCVSISRPDWVFW
jgi:hypothetical protein